MKAQDLKFPLTINWYGNIYRVVENAYGGLDWTMYNNGVEGITYEDSADRESILDSLRKEEAKLVPEPTSAATLQISVRSSGLAEAVKLANELEATLIRIKALLA